MKGDSSTGLLTGIDSIAIVADMVSSFIPRVLKGANWLVPACLHCRRGQARFILAAAMTHEKNRPTL
jgi:hypothetical protein